jgi:hypothetical protein
VINHDTKHSKSSN